MMHEYISISNYIIDLRLLPIVLLSTEFSGLRRNLCMLRFSCCYGNVLIKLATGCCELQGHFPHISICLLDSPSSENCFSPQRAEEILPKNCNEKDHPHNL
uniref:Uncharacterized protein n=1 Tax=Micrurus spixii TaxID=129469 RepID=A0A2D4MEB4_9SAUR